MNATPDLLWKLRLARYGVLSIQVILLTIPLSAFMAALCFTPADAAPTTGETCQYGLEFWFNRYQTLIVGIITVGTAIWAGLAVYKQLGILRDQADEQQQLRNRQYAADKYAAQRKAEELIRCLEKIVGFSGTSYLAEEGNLKQPIHPLIEELVGSLNKIDIQTDHLNIQQAVDDIIGIKGRIQSDIRNERRRNLRPTRQETDELYSNFFQLQDDLKKLFQAEPRKSTSPHPS